MSERCRLIVPDGSLQKVVSDLLTEAGILIRFDSDRGYRGRIDNPTLFPEPDNFVLRMRPWDAPWIIADGRMELAFSADDLIAESSCADQVVVLRHYQLSRGGVGKTKLVLAVPDGSSIGQVFDLTPDHELVTEYPNLAKTWLEQNGVCPRIRTCHGSLEAYINIADAILENTETGNSLKVGGWKIIAEVMTSTTCLITNKAAMAGGKSKEVIDQFCLLLDSVVSGRARRLLKCNVPAEKLSDILAILPSATRPTVNRLANGGPKWFAVESIIQTKDIAAILPQLKAAGAKAIFDQEIYRFVP